MTKEFLKISFGIKSQSNFNTFVPQGLYGVEQCHEKTCLQGF